MYIQDGLSSCVLCIMGCDSCDPLSPPEAPKIATNPTIMKPAEQISNQHEGALLDQKGPETEKPKSQIGRDVRTWEEASLEGLPINPALVTPGSSWNPYRFYISTFYTFCTLSTSSASFTELTARPSSRRQRHLCHQKLNQWAQFRQFHQFFPPSRQERERMKIFKTFKIFHQVGGTIQRHQVSLPRASQRVLHHQFATL